MPKPEPFLIKEHISIEEAREQGLTQIVKQLEIDALTRKGLGMKSHQEAISTNHISDSGRGRPRKDKSVSFTTAKKMIRVNPHNLV